MAEESLEQIKVGTKPIERYVSAYLFAKSEDKDAVKITGRGHNIKRCIDVAAILLRKYLEPIDCNLQDALSALESNEIDKAKDIINKLLICEVNIGSEAYGERYVSTIDIIIRGDNKHDKTD